ncbi:MAG: O-antigen ligase family protein [Candidatus Poribacteria bacterium]|nr:O-antigen ligase family protein [Candidatus Poribacteria bacterium]MDE0505740.1 O-antigen ligase family protein [Candidatus Poribacteria bacterium]
MNLVRIASKHLSLIALIGVCCVAFGMILAIYSETPIPVLCALAVSSVLVFLAPDLVLYVLLICLPFSFRYFLPSQVEIQTPTEPLLGLLIAIFWLKKIVNRAISPDPAPQEEERFPIALPLTVYIAVTFVPTINTPDLFVTLKGAFRASVYMMTGFLAYELIRNRQSLHRLFISTFPSALVAVVWTSCVLIYQIDQWQWRSAYLGTPFTNHASYGSFAGVFFLIVLSRLLFDRSNYDRVIWTIMLFIFGIGLLVCFSRGVWLSLIVAVGFLLMQIKTGEQHKKVLFAGAVTILLLLIVNFPMASNIVQERVSSVFDFQFASNQARLLRWGQALLLFLESPIIGNGYGAFAILYEADASLVGEYTAQFQLGAHSEYLQVLAELGIVGFVAWMWLVIAFFRYGFRALKHIDDGFYRSLIIGLLSAELSLLVHFAVNNLLNGDAIAIPFWLIYGLLPAVAIMAKRERESELAAIGRRGVA